MPYWKFVPSILTGYISSNQDNWNFVGTLATQQRYYIKGTVTTTGGTGFAGVRVYLSGQMPNIYVTKANGYYEFTNLIPGNYYRVIPYKQGYSFTPPDRKYLSLESNKDNQDFQETVGTPPAPAPPKGISSVFIVVKNDNGKGMEGVKLNAIPIEKGIRDEGLRDESSLLIPHPSSPIPYPSITDKDGMADLLQLYGTYEIRASKEGYKPQTKIITITEEENAIDLEFNLEPIPILPATNKLYQNYPNPFNPNQEVTKIPYDLSQGAYVIIKIYNIAGELVRTLEETRSTAGSYELPWNGRNDDNEIVSAGVYFYQLYVSGSVVGTKKILVIK